MENPIGQKLPGFGYASMKPTIIGIVKDFHIDSLHRTIRPLVLQMKYFNSGPFILVRAQAQNLSQAIETLKSTWEEVSPNRRYGGHWFLNQSLSARKLSKPHAATL